MAEEKPKHKPQKKHTLSEVLKSLQDLIRTDLVPAPPPPKPAPPAREPETLSPAEPDSFNQALEALDEIITHRIIEPATRTQEQAPAAADDTVEIDWDDLSVTESTQPAVETASPGDVSIETTPAPPDTEDEIELHALPGDSELQAPNADDSEPQRKVDIETEPALVDISEETIDLGAPFEEAPPGGTQEEFTFSLTMTDSAPRPSDNLPEPPETPLSTSDGSEQNSEAERPAVEAANENDKAETPIEPPTVALEPASAPKSAAGAEAESVATPPDEPGGATGHEPQAPENEKPEEKAAYVTEGQSGTNDAPSAAPPAVADSVAAAPEDRRMNREPAANENEVVTSDQQSETPRMELDIPVLNDVADVEAPPSPPLPDASQARDIAIRVIAKLNIERRKAGEPQLDIKTIERMQQYLADALTKRALNKPK